ncbi:MAG TPA: biotin transporter BioY [Flavobacteriales bacterium]|jgi:biotin transporter BioY|nr:biotin transporter BioY [Flavobacteriales bacterium]
MFETQLNERGWRWPITALILVAFLGTLGPIVIDLEQGLPLSLQSLLVCWLPLMLGWRAGVSGVLAYLAIGIAGVPVFAGYNSGLEALSGPTGGYLMGMPVAALVLGAMGEGTLADASDRERYLRVAFGMVLGHIVILGMGIPWQMKFAPDLDVRALLERLWRPLLLKSTLGLLLSVIAIRATATRA